MTELAKSYALMDAAFYLRLEADNLAENGLTDTADYYREIAEKLDIMRKELD